MNVDPRLLRAVHADRLDVRPLRAATSHAIAELWHAGASAPTALVKELNPDRLPRRVRLAKSAIPSRPDREPAAYRDLLGDGPAGPAAALASVSDHRAGLWGVVLEHVAHPPLTQVGSTDSWLGAAAWMATFHSWSERTVASARPVPFVDYGRRRFDAWWRAAVTRQPVPGLGRLVSLRPAFERATDLLDRGPQVVVHGEWYPANVLVDDAGDRVCVVDWECVGVGHPALDLAALATGWSDHRPFVERYLAASRPGALGPDPWASVSAARLVMAVRWLATERAATPVEHATDWCAEAEAAAGVST